MLAVPDSAELVMVCPRCGGRLRPRAPSFPRCPRCRMLLVTCRYCLHYDTTVLDCGHPLLRDHTHVTDPDIFTQCPYHASSLSITAPAMVRARLVKMAVAACVLFTAATLLAFFFRAGPVAREQTLFMAVRAPDQLTEGETGTLSLLIWNAGEEPTQRVVVALNRTYLSKFRFESMEPRPANVVLTSGVRYFYYGPLPTGESMRVEMRLTARRVGTHKLKVWLYSEQGLQRSQEADTTVMP